MSNTKLKIMIARESPEPGVIRVCVESPDGRTLHDQVHALALCDTITLSIPAREDADYEELRTQVFLQFP